MKPFFYRRPDGLAAAAQLMQQEPEAKLLGGGMTLLPVMKQRLAAPLMLVDVAQLDELKGIERTQAGLRIGAAAIHADVAASTVVRAALPGLAGLASVIGDPMVRNRGTLGGSLANNDPSADYPAAALALNAVLRTNLRQIPATDFFMGLFSTALMEGEILVDIVFAIPRRSAYVKLRNQASRFAKCGIFVAQWTDGSVTLAATGAGNGGVFRPTQMERALERNFHPDSLDGILPDPTGMLSDATASGRYRAHLVNTLSRRAVQTLLADGG